MFSHLKKIVHKKSVKIHGFVVGITIITKTRTRSLYFITYDNSFQKFINKKIVIDFREFGLII